MKEVEIETSGILTPEEIDYFGGTYSFWERIRLQGVGSPKIIYEKGIPAFDAFVRDVEGELSFVSFELLRNGLILRLNVKLELRCVGTRLTEIDKIKLIAFRNEGGKDYHGELEIILLNGSSCTFEVFTQNFSSLLQFFRKQPFVGKLAYSINA